MSDREGSLPFPNIKPKPSLRLTTHLPGQIYSIDSFLSTFELDAIREWTESISLEGPKKPGRGEAERTSRRGAVDSTEIAHLITTSLLPFLRQLDPPYTTPAPMCSPNIRVYHYPPKTYFRGHYDSPQLDIASKRLSCWTVLIYLTEVTGGGTTFWLDGTARDDRKGGKAKGKSKGSSSNGGEPRRITIDPAPGRVVLHWHGVARGGCMLHEGDEVVEGDKWVLRTDVLA